MLKLLKHHRFPWRIFTHIILIQAGIILTLFLLAGLGVRSYFQSQYLKVLQTQQFSESHLNEVLRAYDTTLILFITGVAVILGVFATVITRRLVFPIRHLLVRAKSVLNREAQLQKNDNNRFLRELDYDSYGEWSDLESSIEDIRRDLQAKIESLKIEREEQATLMSAISDAILAVDSEGAPLFYNSRLALLLGNLPLRPPIRLWEIFRDPEILDAFKQTLKEGKSASVKAIPFDLPTGRRFFSISVSPLRKGKESIYGAVGVFHDVTELKSAEQIRIDFVANVSHELRTPLTAIKGYADTLVQDSRDGKPMSTDFLEIITRNTDRLMSLINDLLDLSALESTEVLHKTNLSTEEVTSRVLQQMQGVFEAKKQEITTEIKNPAVTADPKRLEQVLVNLLDNANKYTPVGSHIFIRWEGEGDESILKVKDSGPGVPPEHHLRLFERFYRVDKARSREQGGTGLGLAIVKHIMQRHDGSVWVESAPGKGATFVCRFPS